MPILSLDDDDDDDVYDEELERNEQEAADEWDGAE
jgi:hypothetical protein